MPPPSKPGFETPPNCHALVTGSSGFVGSRLVEMLLERGAKTVIAMDITPPSDILTQRFKDVQEKTGGKIIVLSQTEGDLCSDAAVEAAFAKVPQLDVVFHIAALVGPFHKREMYEKVNVFGTKRLLEYSQKHKVPKFVYSSSPSTRFRGGDVEGLREEQLPIPETFVALYAETKARGEVLVHKACNGKDFLTVSVAPHQVYGPHDSLMLPKLLETAGSGRLRIFGPGTNKISFTHVDNYCHGLLCGADALYPDSPALATYYVVTDEEPQYFWKAINRAAIKMGFADLESKFHLPIWLLYSVAYVCVLLKAMTGKQFKLTPFTVKMLVIHRYFDIHNAKRDLLYVPLKTFEEGWSETLDWFQVNWLPKWKEEGAAAM